MMNRRDFLRRLGGAAAAISLSPLLDLAPIEPAVSEFVGPITFKGIPLVYSKYCPNNTIYFLNPQHLWVNYGDGEGWQNPFVTTDNPRRLGVLTSSE